MTEAAAPEKRANARDAIVDAALRLAARRDFSEVTLTDIAREAGVSLADFRDAFPSKGAALGAFWRRIDRIVLDAAAGHADLGPARERLSAVLRRRLDAVAPYRDALASIARWALKDPLIAAALNREDVNSMRFMLEAADIDSEGPAGALKLQGLAFAWRRVLAVWFDDPLGEIDSAYAALERELARGEKFVDRAEDVVRLTAPLRTLATRFFSGFRPRADHAHDHAAADHGWPEEERAPHVNV
jgi:AcrR family transcriptional regulator